MGFDTIESIVQELKLFTENDADIYRRTTTPIVRNLRTKQAQGKYDHEQAVQAFMYLAETGARKYAREHSDSEAEWHAIFPTDVRRAAAKAWRDEFEEESRLGNYDNAIYLPKKYLEKLQSGKKTKIETPHSEAYYAGLRNGRHYADLEGSSRRELEALVKSPNYRPHNAAVAGFKNMAEMAKFLGLSEEVSIQDFAKAFREYDKGFKRGAVSVFDAMEGN